MRQTPSLSQRRYAVAARPFCAYTAATSCSAARGWQPAQCSSSLAVSACSSLRSQPHRRPQITTCVPSYLTSVAPVVHHAQLLDNWYKDGADKKGIITVVTAGKEGAVVGGSSFLEALGDDLLDSIVGDQIPIYTEQEKYNLTVESTVDRVAAKLKGQPVPGEPQLGY